MKIDRVDHLVLTVHDTERTCDFYSRLFGILLNLPLEGTHHRGGDDACNITGILSEVLLQRRH